MKKTFAVLSSILLVLVFAVPILGITDGESRIIQAIRECCAATGATATQANPGSNASKATSVQGIDGGKAVAVSGTFFQATQPVSLASVPSHAVTNAGTFAVQSTTAASENHIGEVSGRSAIVSANFTRPSDTTTYASGDLIANSTTAGSVVPITLAVSRAADLTGMIRRVRLKKTSTAGAGTVASFRVHFFAASPTVTNGDNGVWLATESSYLGACDVSTDRVFSDAAKGIGAPNTGGEINFMPATGTVNVFALLESRSSYIPTSAEVFTLTVEVFQN